MIATWTRSEPAPPTARTKPRPGPWHLLAYPGKTKCGIDTAAHWVVADYDFETAGDVRDQTGGAVCYRCTGASTKSDKISYNFDNSVIRPHIAGRKAPFGSLGQPKASGGSA